MRFLVIERMNVAGTDPKEFAKVAREELEYKRKLEKSGKIIGGPFLDILAGGYILETRTLEEMGEIFFNSPANFFTEREVHPVGSFADSLEGMQEFPRKR
jgi:hypothetical protein